MHPNPTFAWTDRAEMLAFVGHLSFSTIFIGKPEGPRVIHVPVVVQDTSRLRFHVARSNRAGALDGARAFLSCVGPEGYVSPDWYASSDQVPTWNYVAVECEGPLRQLEEEELARLLDQLSAVHEARLAPKRPWTREKMSAGRFEAMMRAIVGYELEIQELRGTRKLGQHKKGADRSAAAAGVAAAGNAALAELMLPRAGER